MKRDEKIEYIAEHYGFEKQCRQCVEEMAELTKEICKYFRADNEPERVYIMLQIENELADVEIMVRQLKLLSNYETVEDVINKKLDRQLNRIAEEKGTC